MSSQSIQHAMRYICSFMLKFAIGNIVLRLRLLEFQLILRASLKPDRQQHENQGSPLPRGDSQLRLRSTELITVT